MKLKYETKVTIDDNPIYEKELTIEDGDKTIIKAAILAALAECKRKCMIDVPKAIDGYDA